MPLVYLPYLQVTPHPLQNTRSLQALQFAPVISIFGLWTNLLSLTKFHLQKSPSSHLSHLSTHAGHAGYVLSVVSQILACESVILPIPPKVRLLDPYTNPPLSYSEPPFFVMNTIHQYQLEGCC
jgi:hypothetical protein